MACRNTFLTKLRLTSCVLAGLRDSYVQGCFTSKISSPRMTTSRQEITVSKQEMTDSRRDTTD